MAYHPTFVDESGYLKSKNRPTDTETAKPTISIHRESIARRKRSHPASNLAGSSKLSSTPAHMFNDYIPVEDCSGHEN